VAERLAEYVADVAFGTSFLALGEEEFPPPRRRLRQPELCAITKTDLHRAVSGCTAQLGPGHPGAGGGGATGGRRVVGAAMSMKHRFLTSQEALLHGDLHTGSVFVRGGGRS